MMITTITGIFPTTYHTALSKTKKNQNTVAIAIVITAPHLLNSDLAFAPTRLESETKRGIFLDNFMMILFLFLKWTICFFAGYGLGSWYADYRFGISTRKRRLLNKTHRAVAQNPKPTLETQQ